MQGPTVLRQAGILVLLLVLVLLVGVKSASIRSNRARRTIPSRHLLIGYWGQNGAGHSVGPVNYEKPLRWFCQNSKYDIINLAFLVTFFDSRNADSLPGLNFAFHCGGGVSPQHPFLLRCPAIEKGIRTCQQNRKKVLLSLGGSTGSTVLESRDIAVRFANTLWQLFLGGNDAKMRNLRPFGNAILDGIDLNIEGGSHQYFPDLIRELRRLMASDSSKSYLVTSAPQCPHPDHWLGPQKPGTALEDTGELTNYTFIQFYNNPCWTGAGQTFESSLSQWLSFSSRKNVGIMIGLPAHPKASSQTRYHRDINELRSLYEQIRNKVGVSGLMLWDCSWDQNNLVNGKMYSEHVRGILDATPTEPPTTTQSTPINITSTPPPSSTTPVTTIVPNTTPTPPPPDTTTTHSQAPDTTTTQSPAPDTSTKPAPDTTATPPSPITTTKQSPAPDTTATPPAPDTTTTQSPAPDTTTTPPSQDTTTKQSPAPNTTTTPPSPDTTTKQPATPGTTTGPTVPATFCQGKAWKDYKHPLDCTKFISCAPNGMHIRSCPAGLRFNPLYLVCDWPQNVPCSSRQNPH